jgi:hypothetical protein
MSSNAPPRIEQVLAQLGRWACLVGPQSAGKTVYAQYLDGYSASDPHQWTLRSQLAQAAGQLTFSRITTTRRPLLEKVASPGNRDSRRFWRADGTKDLVIFDATSARANQGQTEIHFIDVPGEAVSHPQIEDLRRVLRGTRAVLLFVPVWGLLPARWLKESGYARLYTPAPGAGGAGPLELPSWGTSLHADLDPGSGELPVVDPEVVRRSQFQGAVDLLGKHVDQWSQLLFDLVPRGTDLLIVLSQFQREPVEALFDGFFQSRAGSDLWQQYDRLLGAGQRGADGTNLAAVTAKLQEASDLGLDLLTRVAGQAANLPDGGTPRVCQTLLRFRRPTGAIRRGERAELDRFRSVSILPLNVVAIRTEQDWALWRDKKDAASLVEMRMCEDLLWWILLHQRGHEIWRW